MDIGLMVEGHQGLTWERWSHILAMTERLGFRSLFRSDHYAGEEPKDSLDPFLSFVLAAKDTTQIRFGPLVTPVTFRSPVEVGRMSAQVDLLSEGRFVLGIGAGWYEPEHRAYGISFPPVKERFDRLEEAIAVIKALWAPGPVSYSGHYYRLEDVDCLPKPKAGRPPILIGGNGERRSLPLVAQYANEWNSVNLSPDAYRRKVEVLERHCEVVKRDPTQIRRSMLYFGIIGPDQAGLELATRSAMSLSSTNRSTSTVKFREEAREQGMIVGLTNEVVDWLGQLAELGIQEVQFEHLDFTWDEFPEYLASEIAPAVAGF